MVNKIVLQFKTCPKKIEHRILKNEKSISLLMTPKTQKARTEIIVIK